MTVLLERAPGKLNLTLDVLGLREDGYHELEMVMTSVGLWDELRIELDTDAPWRVDCSPGALPRGEGNLCWKAARAYFDRAGIQPRGLSICVDKQIPAQAGMAGGSSDAAAVLRALNRHYGCFSDETLRQISLQIGSDVPYCLFGGTALARGRGEVLERLPPVPQTAAFVLVRPDFSLSTPALFAALDRVGVSRRPDTAAMCRALTAGDPAAMGRALCNAFSPVASARFPVIDEIKTRLLALGALGAELTGTGSVVFGLFADAGTAAVAAEALLPLYPLVRTAAPL